MKFLQANALSFICLLAMFAVGLYMYPSLPNSIPTHYSFDGRMMVISGTLLLLVGYTYPSLAVTLTLGLSRMVPALAYSFLFYLKDERVI